MTLLKRIFEIYINSSIHVSLAVTALTVVSSIHLGFPADVDLLFFIFFGAVTGYNFVKYAGIAKLHHRSLAKNLKVIQVFSFLSFIALIYFAFRINPKVLLVALFLGVLTLFYALPFLGERNLRTIGGIKIYLISLIWAGVTVIFPAVNVDTSFSMNLLLEFIQRLLFVLILLIPFEIRDLKYDDVSLKTLPQNIGVRGSKVTGIVFLILMFIIELLKDSATAVSLTALGIIAVLTAWAVVKAEEEQPSFYSSFWVEGLPLLWLAILLMLKNLL